MAQYGEIIKWPDSLPLPQQDFNGSHSTPTITTQFTSGRIRRRSIGRTSVKRVTLNWLFTPDEYDMWEVFFRDALKDGCNRFEINMVTGGSSQTGNHVVQCTSDPSFGHEECNWRVSVDCVIHPYPMSGPDKLIESYLGSSIEAWTEVIDKYYDERYMQ